MRRPGGKKTLAPEQAADVATARNAAVGLLSRRDHSSADLSRKLAQRGFTPAAITQALAELGDSKALNDDRYSQNLVAYRSRRGQGPARIRQELQRSGFDRTAIDAAVKSEDAPDFAALAATVRARKFGQKLPTDHKERARQARFLQYRGFSTDHIRAVLAGSPDEPDPGPDGESDQS
jgi:regulatory protein